jgi:hypothetical protein
MGESINRPTRNNMGAVAACGIIKNNGAKNSARRNKAATVKAVRPVLPPSATPEALST